MMLLTNLASSSDCNVASLAAEVGFHHVSPGPDTLQHCRVSDARAGFGLSQYSGAGLPHCVPVQLPLPIIVQRTMLPIASKRFLLPCSPVRSTKNLRRLNCTQDVQVPYSLKP